MSMRSRLLASGACALAVALVVGGCDGSESADSEPNDRTRSTSSEASPPPSGPKAPAKAADAGAEGAKAYVGYYVDVVNHAADSGDTQRLNAEASECGYCQQFAAVYEDIYDNGGSFDGQPYELKGVDVSQKESNVRAVATVESRTGATFQIAQDAQRRQPDARTFTWTFDLRRVDDGWRIVGMEESF